jgi:trehalose 6-phosphate phosphatase
MYRILARRHLHRLETFAASNVVVAFDFDGTLAPLVETPSRAALRGTTRRLLASAARLYPVAVISGRARADVARRLESVPVRHVTGNHGLEPWGERPEHARLVRAWTAQLEAAFADWSGVTVENKTYSLTVHYRAARGKARVVERVREFARALRNVRAVGGIDSIALVPGDAPHKGAALERTRQLLACDTAIYVGDDETDEDVFRSGDSGPLLGIRVGARRGSRAAYCLTSQEEIDSLLRVLIECRRRGGPSCHPNLSSS